MIAPEDMSWVLSHTELLHWSREFFLALVVLKPMGTP